jgi:hydroxylamine reductase (hybrid-cluster protein)
MNIIELVKDVVMGFPNISDLHIDYTESDPDNYGLYPTGDQLLKEDVLGNQTRQHNFVLYAIFQSLNDYERIANSTFLLDLAYWLEKAAKNQSIEVTINEHTVNGTLKKLSSANGMLYGYQEGTLSGPVTYQLQIYAQYHLESEEF